MVLLWLITVLAFPLAPGENTWAFFPTAEGTVYLNAFFASEVAASVF